MYIVLFENIVSYWVLDKVTDFLLLIGKLLIVVGIGESALSPLYVRHLFSSLSSRSLGALLQWPAWRLVSSIRAGPQLLLHSNNCTHSLMELGVRDLVYIVLCLQVVILASFMITMGFFGVYEMAVGKQCVSFHCTYSTCFFGFRHNVSLLS